MNHGINGIHGHLAIRSTRIDKNEVRQRGTLHFGIRKATVTKHNRNLLCVLSACFSVGIRGDLESVEA